MSHAWHAAMGCLLTMFTLPEGFDLLGEVGGYAYDASVAGGFARRTCARCGRPIPKTGGVHLRNQQTAIAFVLGRSCVEPFLADVADLRAARQRLGTAPLPSGGARTPQELDHIEVYAGFRRQLRLLA